MCVCVCVCVCVCTCACMCACGTCGGRLKGHINSCTQTSSQTTHTYTIHTIRAHSSKSYHASSYSPTQTGHLLECHRQFIASYTFFAAVTIATTTTTLFETQLTGCFSVCKSQSILSNSIKCMSHFI